LTNENLNYPGDPKKTRALNERIKRRLKRFFQKVDVLNIYIFCKDKVLFLVCMSLKEYEL
jgi:hypothetical protein